MTANYYPDGLTFETITALQNEVDDELRHEGYHLEPSPWTPCGTPTSQTHQRRNRRFSRRRVRSRRTAAQPPADQLHRGVDDGREVPWPIRQRVLRGYHATNLAKAREASEELVRDGWNTGGVPYGYRSQRIRITPHGRRPRYRIQLVVEPIEASVVRMIFVWRVHEQLSLTEIRRLLTESRYPAPLDPETGQPGAWTHSAVRAVLRNPKYLGRQVWGRRHHGRRTPQKRWVWSDTWAHSALVDAETFAAAAGIPSIRRTGRRRDVAPEERQ